MSYRIKLDLNLPGDHGAFNGPRGAGLFKGWPGAFQSSLTQNKRTAGEAGGTGPHREAPPSEVLAPPEVGLAVELGLSVPQEGNSSETLEMPHSGDPQTQALNEEYFWKPNKNMPCQQGEKHSPKGGSGPAESTAPSPRP